MTYANDKTFNDIFWETARVVTRVNRGRWVTTTAAGSDYVHGPHAWHRSLQERFQLHPVVDAIVKRGIRPVDWHLLLLEWAHVSEDDPQQIAYTRDERKGTDNVQTRTSIGKYIARHWPHVPDHVRRDWGEAYGSHEFAMWDTREHIICGIELGPQSCMKSSYGNIPFGGDDNAALCTWFGGDKDITVAWDNHPYAVYAPAYGWRMAVRIDPGKPDIILGRGLVNVNQKAFVRTYKRGEYDHSNSGTDERLEAWLRSQGYERHSSWDTGLPLRKLPHPTYNCGFMLPYIDGNTQTVEAYHDHLRIDGDGEYKGDNTDGTPTHDEREMLGECEDCGDAVYEDDDNRLWTGRHEDRLIGGDCGCARHYTYVRGGDGSGRTARYYIHDDCVLTVDAQDYDESNVPDYIHELHDGEFAHEDDCVWVESRSTYYLNEDTVRCETDDEYYAQDDDDLVEIDGEWYRKDDDNVVKCYDDAYRMKCDCWESPLGNWHSDEYDPIVVADGNYSADALRGIADDNE